MQDAFQPPIRSGVHAELAGYSTKGQMIGKGATAWVFKGTCLKTGQDVAIKEIDHSRLGNMGAKQRQLMESEILIMRQLSQTPQENILSLRDDLHYTTPQGYRYQYLILDYCNGEDFQQFLKRKRGMVPEDEALLYMTQFGRSPQP